MRDGDAAGPAREPIVTVGVPVWNGEAFLEQTLAALAAQSLTAIEVFVADNAATDGTRAIVERFAATDPRFHYLGSDANRGIPWNWNRLLDEARSPYFMWNAADDVARPGHLAACVAALDEHPEATIAFSRVRLIDAAGATVGAMDDDGLDFLSASPAGRLDLFLARRAYQVIGYGGVHRTSVLRAGGGLPPFYGGDIALATWSAVRAPWVQVPEQLFEARHHDEQMTKLQGGDPLHQQRMYRPGLRGPFAFPQWTLNTRLLVLAATTPSGAGERARAVCAVLRRWTLPNWRFFPFDVKRNLIRLARGRYVGAYHAT